VSTFGPGEAPKFFAGYAGLWIVLAGMANTRQTATLAVAFAWTIALAGAIVWLPDALKDFKITGDILGGSPAPTVASDPNFIQPREGTPLPPNFKPTGPNPDFQ
jgi:hypothetical protein